MSLAEAAPVSLGDSVLDLVTAGSSETVGSGGAIVAGNSSATIDSTGTVEISGEAQSGAKGLNIVSSTVSTVANGVNLWDGQLSAVPRVVDEGAAAQNDGVEFNIDQKNNVVQEQRRQANLYGYARTGENVTETISKSGTSTKDITYESDIKHYDFKTVKTENSVESTGNLNTAASLTLGSFTNILGTEIKDFSFGIQGGQGGVAAGALSYDRPGSSFDLTIDNFADIPGKIVFSHQDPDISVDITGTMCLAQGGSCDGSGKTFDSSEDTVDKSVFEVKSGTENSTDTYTYDSTRTVYAPLSVQDASAEYIVADGSTLTVKTLNGILLSGSAQSNMTGLNVVNAAGSAVANGVNISRTNSGDLVSGGGRVLNLNQSNVIIHNR